MTNLQRVSVVVTVKNEAAVIREFLESLSNQTRPPDEIIIVDGGSTDGTLEQVRQFSRVTVHLLQEKCNIARGRNIGIETARYDAVAVTDVGCVLAPNWLGKITENLVYCDVVVGNYRARNTSCFDACQYSFTNLFGSDKCLEEFAISSRSLAFRKAVWKEIGGYPEWLDYSEDAYFHDQIRGRNYQIIFQRDAFVEWTQRQDFRGIFLQYFRYMRGEALGRRHTWRNILRFVSYLAGVCTLSAAQSHPLVLFPLVACVVLYVQVPVRNFRKLGAYPLSVKAIFTISGMLLCIDCAKMTGYLSGLFELVGDWVVKRRVFRTETP
jgi:glycosyltransferase involved in cell wall biosynthesis